MSRVKVTRNKLWSQQELQRLDKGLTLPLSMLTHDLRYSPPNSTDTLKTAPESAGLEHSLML